MNLITCLAIRSVRKMVLKLFTIFIDIGQYPPSSFPEVLAPDSYRAHWDQMETSL
jgi:hypothetical protein